MPRRKKHTKLPNGYGSISFLGNGRRRPYGVYPPARERVDGKTVRPKAIGYTETYEKARELLALYHNGLDLPDATLIPSAAPTFADVYRRYYEDKYENPAASFSYSAKNAQKKGFARLASLHDKPFDHLTYPDLQAAVDAINLSKPTVEQSVTVIKGMYAYAEKMGIIDKDQSRHVSARVPSNTEHGVPFSIEDIKTIWNCRENSNAQLSLLLIYSGFRISAIKELEIHLSPEWYFKGGVKTAAGKGRIVPIHTAIREVTERLVKEGLTLNLSYRRQYDILTTFWESKGIHDHSPHDCRHTFSALCERYHVPEADRKRLLGHSFGSDITNGVYGHRTVEELRESIELIPIPDLL